MGLAHHFSPIYSVCVMDFISNFLIVFHKTTNVILKISRSLTVAKITLKNHKGRTSSFGITRIILKLWYSLLCRTGNEYMNWYYRVEVHKQTFMYSCMRWVHDRCGSANLWDNWLSIWKIITHWVTSVLKAQMSVTEL